MRDNRSGDLDKVLGKISILTSETQKLLGKNNGISHCGAGQDDAAYSLQQT